MEDGQASMTAQMVALSRVAHMEFDKPPYIFEDPLARDFVAPEMMPFLDLLKTPPDPHPGLQNSRIFLPYRARLIEDRLAAMYAQGLRQYVLLGAGLDSYALRQDPSMADLQIFEVDHPDSQSFKQARMQANEWHAPGNLHYAACDFEVSGVDEALTQTCYDPGAPSLIAWAGVVPYLSKESVVDTIARVSQCTAPGSVLMFDYMPVRAELSEDDCAIIRIMNDYTSGENEPFVNAYETEEIKTVFEDAGFARLDHDDVDAGRRRFFEGRQDGREMPTYVRMAWAVR